MINTRLTCKRGKKDRPLGSKSLTQGGRNISIHHVFEEKVRRVSPSLLPGLGLVKVLILLDGEAEEGQRGH